MLLDSMLLLIPARTPVSVCPLLCCVVLASCVLPAHSTESVHAEALPMSGCRSICSLALVSEYTLRGVGLGLCFVAGEY